MSEPQREDAALPEPATTSSPPPATARRRRVRRARFIAVTAVLALVAGYGTLDAHDLVPGFVTLEPEPPAAQPFPGLRPPADPVAPDIATVVDAQVDQAPIPEPAVFEALLADFEDDWRRTGGFSALFVDALSGEDVAAYNPGIARTPASSLKVVTAAAALATFEAGRTLRTETVLSGTTVTLVGGGDAMLAEGAGNPDSVSGRAGLADLAEQTATALQERDISEVALSVDDTLFTGPTHHPDWHPLDYEFVMGVQPLAVNSGRTSNGHREDPAAHAAGVFAEALREQDIAVSGPTRASAPPEAEVLAAVESAPIGAVVRHMLRDSDNSVAEVLLRLVAIEREHTPDFEGGATAAAEAVAGLGVDTGSLTMADGSGMSPESEAPPLLLVGLLELSGEQPQLAGLVSALPVAHLHGTLSGRFPEAGAGAIRAKTGTLIRTVSLTGLVTTADGRPLFFSVILGDLEPGTAGQGRLALDDFLAGVAACGCSGNDDATDES